MTERNSQEESGSDKNGTQKKQGHFDLKLISTIIMVSSIIFGILIYRGVKKVIKKPPKYSSAATQLLHQRKGMNSGQRAQHYQQHIGAIAAAARREKVRLHAKPLRDRVVNHFPNRHLSVAINPARLTLSRLDKGVKSNVQEVSNVTAVDKKYIDQFDRDDIFDQKLGKIFVKKDEADKFKNISHLERVSFNQRTRQLGIITGKLILKFSTAESFEQRAKYYPKKSVEQRIFPATALVIVDILGGPSLNDLLAIKEDLTSHPELKRVRVEVLEHGKDPH